MAHINPPIGSYPTPYPVLDCRGEVAARCETQDGA